MSDAQFVQIERREKHTESEFVRMMAGLDARKQLNLLPPQLPTEDLPTRRAENFVTPAAASVPDCLTCGACCRFLFVIAVASADSTPPENVWTVTDESGEIVVDAYLKCDPETLSCTALESREDGTMPCGIYEQRPSPCRKFEAGSDKCHAVRRAFNLEPFLAMDKVFEAWSVIKARESEPVAPQIVREAKISKAVETSICEIIVELQNGEKQTVHRFDPRREFWTQTQFRGVPLAEVRSLIELGSDGLETASNFL